MSNISIKMVIVVRKDLNMRKGKIAAQAAHAASKWMLKDFLRSSKTLSINMTQLQHDWLNPEIGNMAKIVVGCENEEELDELIAQAQIANVDHHKIIDAGHTEFHGIPTVTCAAFGPESCEILNKITGHLKLL